MIFKQKGTILTYFFQLSCLFSFSVFAVRVVTSNIKLGQRNPLIDYSGFSLQDTKPSVQIEDLTICIRYF